MRNQIFHSVLTRSPTVETSHVGFGTGLVQKDQLLNVQSPLLLLPNYPAAFDITSLLFIGMQRFF